MLAWLDARAQRGRFVLRIEDLDPGRARRLYETTVLEDLRWLGIDWDEGPDRGGPHGPYRQSERHDRYAEVLARLPTYPCSCTRKELRLTASAPHGIEPVYPATCRDRPPSPARPLALRWRTPAGEAVAHDRFLGRLHQDVAREIGDVVLQRGDGAYAYQLAVVVDDAAMGITDVVRGADLWSSTPRQVWLQRALGLPTPRYTHVPLVLGPDGDKLSKRHGAPEMVGLRRAGVDGARVVALLARSANLCGPAVRRVRPRELVDDFDWARLTEPGATHVLDLDGLRA